MLPEDENDYEYDNKEEEDVIFESPLLDEQEKTDDLIKETAADGGEELQLGDYSPTINPPAQYW